MIIGNSFQYESNDMIFISWHLDIVRQIVSQISQSLDIGMRTLYKEMGGILRKDNFPFSNFTF